MGADIYGWVEVLQELRAQSRWVGVIRIGGLISRSYGMFGCLFGIRNADAFDPVASGRGIPGDASAEVYREWGHDDCLPGRSWILWCEVDNINWEELGDRALWVREEHDDRAQSDESDAVPRLVSLRPMQDEGEVLRRRSRQEALTPQWELLFELMHVLATRYGGEGVRLVVWFDQE